MPSIGARVASRRRGGYDPQAIGNLPAELLLEVAKSVPLSDLLNLRLVNRKSSIAATAALKEQPMRLYLHESRLPQILEACSSPLLDNVTEVVLLDPAMTRGGGQRHEAWPPREVPEPGRENTRTTRSFIGIAVAYEQLFKRLGSLQHFHTVGFSSEATEVGWFPVSAEKLYEWHQVQRTKGRKCPLRGWTDCEMVFSLLASFHDKVTSLVVEKFMKVEGPTRWWHVLGIKESDELFHGVKVTEHMDKLPPWGQWIDFPRPMQVWQNVTRLTLPLDLYLSGQVNVYGGTPLPRAVARILANMPNVQELELRLHSHIDDQLRLPVMPPGSDSGLGTTYCPWKQTVDHLGDIDLPHLRKWTMAGTSDNPEPVWSWFVIRHLRNFRDTLKTVRLHNVYFRSAFNVDSTSSMEQVQHFWAGELQLESFEFQLKRMGCDDDCVIGPSGGQDYEHCLHYRIANSPWGTVVLMSAGHFDKVMAQFGIPLDDDGWWRKSIRREAGKNWPQ